DDADPPPLRDEGVVGDEDHGALLDPRRHPLLGRVRALLPVLLPALSKELDQWAEWLVRGRYAGRAEEEIEEMVAVLAGVRGRVSLFEPVNRRNPSLSTVIDLAELAPLVDERHARRLDAADPMLDFDAADLERYFVEAGFTDARATVVETVQETVTEMLLTTP